MGLQGKKRTMAPQDQNPSRRPRKGPNKKKMVKRKKQKSNMEELKNEVVTVRSPKVGADSCPLKTLLHIFLTSYLENETHRPEPHLFSVRFWREGEG